MKDNDFINVLGYKVYKNKLLDALKYIDKFDKVHIISGNPEVLYTGLYNKELLENFKSDKAFIIPDGVGLQIAAKYLKTPVEEKIAGIDLMKGIIKKCSKENKGIYLLGTSDENLNACVANLMVKYPNINIVGYRNGFFDIDKVNEILNDIKEKEPYAIFVAMGCPRQEEFIVRYMEELPCKIFMGVGGSFDVIAEKVNRAPKWMIKLGLEWLYRVSKEPWRIKRLGSIPKFLLLVAKNKKVKYE
ncbi:MULTISPECIES: WecB/TagA/CpsF family glycosyltransferase [Clostridium]|jgi:N-acetylglucosaminyldiphosphoundecaprenol N-acetyl-beta-D-mannosaminyltransferase|uniref:WecB/TagA/CpsF family glycosyltransferase n=1 Tax=Clostridium TaxID=1485 RepID=UPI0018A98649|nr:MULTISPECIES: WecB/TagA/CpsF family glycosyltransferase [Clostridium]MBS5306414.1 WecB/TagA/CpsF family glycosyltransferase [Clostridium sp.]MDB1933270.1 WecB/TagA/CpsF family glycosyltransferase [Clostridium tertium]MDB1938481.1 WecB/TagA/CpsF family glycosyltransferase [Clostridium tertium]MDB1943954.1 WecB/TagA/CpsF family glycosyltransferase [Clostridium tertium]MDB1950880.1 WecB/TagA/CpsF family glycosyltransferase [Clostridium tertium]